MAWGKKWGNKKGSNSKPSGKARVRRARPNPKIKKVNINKLAYQVAKLNNEKKEFNVYAPSLAVGQFYASTAGSTPLSAHYMSNGITPLPSNGTGDNARIGDEISVTGIRNVFQFSHQANCSQPIKCKIMMFAPKFGVSGASVTIDKLLNVNPVAYYGNGALVSVYDTTSSRNMDYIKDFQLLRSYSFTMPGDQASLSQKIVKTVNVGLKFKKPWKVRFDSAGNISYGQIYCVVVAESGNTYSNTPNSNTIGIPIIDTYSGLAFQWYSKTYFMDS